MSVVLAIDTAAPRLQLALWREPDRVDTLVEDMPTGQAERLFPALAELLAHAGAAYADLTRIAVTTGRPSSVKATQPASFSSAMSDRCSPSCPRETAPMG